MLDLPGVARYGRLLPVANSEDLASCDAALQPVECRRLAEELGVDSLHLLPQTLNSTGTFKDNEGVLVASKCKEWGLGSVCLHSTGNTARAYQYYMERTGIECRAFVPQASAYKCPSPMLGTSSIVAVPGKLINAAASAIQHSETTGAFRLTPTAWKIEGKVPVGLALAEHRPDSTLFAVTVASGYGPLGIERAMQRVREAGLPSVCAHRYRLLQAADAGVLGAAIRSGADEVNLEDMAPPEEAFEPTLQSTNPNRTLPLIRELVRRTGSQIDAVQRDQVEAAAEVFAQACKDLGVPLEYGMEKSAYICWAGLVEAKRRGDLDPKERITMIVSGSAPLAHLP